MTDTNASFAEFQGEMARAATFEVEDIFWGYKIRSGRGAPFSVMFGQAICFFFGVCLLTAAVGILVLPTLIFDGGLGFMRVGAVALLGAAATYLLWFASRGTQSEVHVDTHVAEVREVVCNRAGRPTLVMTYEFEAIGGVYIEEGAESGLSQLLLRYRDTDACMIVAEGTTAQLIPLRDRLGQDLIANTKPVASQAA